MVPEWARTRDTVRFHVCVLNEMEMEMNTRDASQFSFDFSIHLKLETIIIWSIDLVFIVNFTCMKELDSFELDTVCSVCVQCEHMQIYFFQ